MESSARSPDEYIFLTNGARYWVGRVSEIVCIEVSGNYGSFLISSGQKLLIRGSLGQWEKRLPSAIFFRSGRDTIINLQHVTEMRMYSPKQFAFTLTGDNEVIMSRIQTTEFRRTRGL
jgi:DNA-binding LytR/AlgR family response regulator